MSGWQIALIVAAVLLLGLVLLPAFNRWQVPWVRRGRVRVITKKDPFDRWDYPEEQAPLTLEERAQARQVLADYARRSNQRIVWNDKTEQ